MVKASFDIKVNFDSQNALDCIKISLTQTFKHLKFLTNLEKYTSDFFENMTSLKEHWSMERKAQEFFCRSNCR